MTDTASEIEQLRVQLAGCGVAALGGTSPGQVAKPGDYGWSASYGDVLALRQRADRLTEALRRFRYAKAWASAEAWDGSGDSRDRFEWAAAMAQQELGLDPLTDNEIAEIGKGYLGFMGRAPSLSGAPKQRLYPAELTPALREVLGLMIFQTGRIAHGFRDAGEADIPPKAEAEQAFVLHWLIGLALEHGDGWKPIAADKLEEVAALVKAKQAAILKAKQAAP